MATTTSRPSITPAQIAEAVAMREAGFTVLAIAQRLGISSRTLQRHLAAAGARKGRMKAELVEAARHELLKHVNSNDAVREEAARLIADDLAHVAHLRSIMIQAAEHLQASSLSESALLLRAAAAYSTALKNTSDIVRQSLRKDALDVASNDELPELVVRELSEAELRNLAADIAGNSA